jgi:hypothetical protein
MKFLHILMTVVKLEAKVDGQACVSSPANKMLENVAQSDVL